MSKATKTGLLVLILVVPVLFIWLLNNSKSHFEVANFPGPEGSKLRYMLNEDGEVHTLPDFSFTDQQGKVLTKKDVEGKVLIANFMFTRCPSICPDMSTQLKRVQEEFKANPDVLILSHTVDPEYDTVQVLDEYAQAYGAKYGKWYMLTGPKPVLYEQARAGFKLPVPQGDGGPDDFVHSDKLVLLDKKGRIRGFYSGTDPLKVDTLMIETRIVLTETE